MTCRPRRGPIVCIAVLMVSDFCVSQAAAQEAQQKPAMQMNMYHRGGVAGMVRSAAGAAAASGLTVVATNADNGARFTATTDAQGRYSFSALPVGKYVLSIEAGG